MAGSLKRLFLQEKPTRALLAVGEMDHAYAAIVAKQIDSTFPHTSAILSQLEERGLIKSRPEGRVRYLELTDDGKKVAFALKNLIELLQVPNVGWKRLDTLRRIVNSYHGINAAFCLGPLRRDIAKLMSSEDAELGRASEELDASIVLAIKA